jgi:hypothetical protein
MILKWLLGSKVAQAIGGALVALAALWGYGAAKKREGAQAAKNKELQNAQKRVEKGNQAVADTRGDDPAERLRRNDQKWL